MNRSFLLQEEVIHLKIEYVPIGELIPYENNAKQHPKEQIEQIKKSIQEFGNNDPIAIDGGNIIIEGHGRLLALQELGYEEVPVIRLGHLTEEQRKAYTLVHNQLTLNSDFDLDLLKAELDEIINIDMREFDFDYEFPEDEEEVKEDDFDEVVPEEPKAKLGDIYQLGNHRLMCGDSTKLEDVEKLMNGQKVDLYLTDPPYNVALGMSEDTYEARKRHRRTDGLTIMNDKMEDGAFLRFLTDAFSAAKSVMKAGASFYIWHADNEGLNFRMAVKNTGWQLRQTLIWNKNVFTLGRQDYQWKHEPCLYGWNEGASHSWYNDRRQTTVLNFDRPSVSKEHPTMKPVKLFDYQIQNSSKAGDIVYDSFGGSGTTIIACEQNGRAAYVMELDPRFVDVIIARWEELTGEKAVKVDEV